MIGAIEPAVRYSYVLDSSAVIAFLNQEPGSQVVEPVFPVSVISTINGAEVISWLGTARNPSAEDLDTARNILDRRGLSTVEVTEAQAELAGLLTLRRELPAYRLRTGWRWPWLWNLICQC